MSEAVKFLKGTQAQFEALCAAGRYQPGAFYLVIDDTAGATADSLGKPGRLYYGVNSTNIAPVNQGITSVETIENLPTPNALNAGGFYYVTTKNILCISNGDKWVQTNVDTTLNPNDSSIEVGSANNNEATITQVIADSSGNSITQVHTLIGGEHVTLDVNTDNKTVTFNLDGIDYKLHSSAENVSAEDTTHQKLNITLKNDGVKNDAGTTVTIIPSDNLNFETVNANSNQYKLTLDNKVDAFTADNAENGFNFAIGGSAVTSQEAPNQISSKIDPVIKYGGSANEAEKKLVHFKDGIATLNVYTKDEIDKFNNTLNAMVYRGAITKISASEVFTFADAENYSIEKLHNGDVFIYSNTDKEDSTYQGNIVRQGDLFIASGEEDPNNSYYIPADKLTWVYIPSANEPLVAIDDTLTTDKSEPNFSIYRGTDEELLTFAIAANNGLQVTANTPEKSKTKTVTLGHAAEKKSSLSETKKTLEYGNPATETLDITIQDPTEIDSYGHVLQVTSKTYTLKDTHASIQATPHTATGNTLTPAISVDNSVVDLAPIDIRSNTLAVNCISGNTDENAVQIKIEKQKGSF